MRSSSAAVTRQRSALAHTPPKTKPRRAGLIRRATFTPPGYEWLAAATTRVGYCDSPAHYWRRHVIAPCGYLFVDGSIAVDRRERRPDEIQAGSKATKDRDSPDRRKSFRISAASMWVTRETPNETTVVVVLVREKFQTDFGGKGFKVDRSGPRPSHSHLRLFWRDRGL